MPLRPSCPLPLEPQIEILGYKGWIASIHLRLSLKEAIAYSSNPFNELE